ncbi:redox-regulated ATPase YchF, partial [Flavobacteriales bacterium]|nr:redox-regulated ATPase YchF [Flavobacteriales bacterium]
DNIVHVDGSVDPIRDKETIDYELILKDLEAIDKKIQKYDKISRTGDKEARKVLDTLNKYKIHLESGQSVRSLEVEEKEKEHILDLMLLTAKPIMYVCNVDDSAVKSGNEHVDRVREVVSKENTSIITISASTEADIAELDSFEERQMFLDDLGLKEPGVNRVIQTSYDLLDLSTYFTAGVKEVRAWTIRKGMKAPQAAGVIHSDFEKGFIRAEVIKYSDFTELGSELACKENGKMNVEGKEYVVEDGDIMHFRFNN